MVATPMLFLNYFCRPAAISVATPWFSSPSMAHSRSSKISSLVLVPSTSANTACIVGCGGILPKESSPTVVFKGFGIIVTHGPIRVATSFPRVLIGNEKEACLASKYSPTGGV